jgi:hypothetical protein
LARREDIEMHQHAEQMLRQFGYRLVDDAWNDQGRKTFLNSEDADFGFIKELEAALFDYGFKRHQTMLRSFRNDETGEFLEVEIGGPETSGHYLHYFKSE